MAEGLFGHVHGKNEMIEAEHVNLIYIPLYDTCSNKNYKGKCVCGHLFDIDIYFGFVFGRDEKEFK
jgi:hypothetical protein